MLVVGFRGETVKPDDWIMQAIAEHGLGGIILFDRDQQTGGPRNITSPQQVTELVKTLRGAAPDGRLIVSIDQEGGRIARLNPANGFPAVMSQAEVGAANSNAVTRNWASGMVESLTSIGVNFNFTPVVDLAINPTNPAIAELGRAFSADPDVVVACATEEIRVHREAGMKTSLKHFPGFGSATGNTDFEVVDVGTTWSRAELEPFARLIGAGMADSVMVAHLLNRQLDPDRPVSLSRAVVQDLLRGELDFTGPVVSDDMQAVAITSRYGRDESVALALEAGVDLLTFANQAVYDEAVVEGTITNVLGLVQSGRLTVEQIDRSAARVEQLR
nr:glycoside hydrolase family 3 N-terminal domain-containing protein [Allorhizocola rhizosphaerae]